MIKMDIKNNRGEIKRFIGEHIHVDFAAWCFAVLDQNNNIELSKDYTVIEWDSCFCDICGNEIELEGESSQVTNRIIEHAIFHLQG